MKNLMITFLLVFTFAFAKDNSTNSQTLANTHSKCVGVTTSCGIVGIVCSSTTAGLIENAIALDNWVCGAGNQ